MQYWKAKLTSHPAWCVLLLGLALNLSGTWMPLIDRDEPRFAEASREMLARNDWLVPTFNGEPRYDKPPLIYWAEMISYRCLGDTSFAARLPTALFATGTALLIFFWTRRLAPPGTALAAAVIFGTCLQVLIHGRLAVADLAMIFFVCAALWSGWEATRPGLPFVCRWWWMFYASLALGFLAKGPVAWLPVGGLLLCRWWQPRSFHFPLGRFAAGLLVAAGIVALWGIPAELKTHGEYARIGLGYHVLRRSVGVLNGHGAGGWLGWVATLPFFLLTFFFSFFPWAFWVPGALRKWWPGRQNDIFGSYLLIQAGLVFLVFTLVRTKLPHYTLPAFPCLALWLARSRQEGFVKDLDVARWAALMAGLALTITLGGECTRPLFLAHNLFEKARPELTPGMSIAAIDYTEPSLEWEFRQVITNNVQFLSPDQAVVFMQTKTPAVLIMPASLYETNRSRWGAGLPAFRVWGLDFSKGRPAELTAVIKK